MKFSIFNFQFSINTEKALIIIFFLFAFILRLWRVTEYPAGLNADEAAIGYNAYSLLKTGKDEFGHSWPIAFQSFNDWKPGFYVYLDLPFVAVLGLNELAVRLPSVILGTMTVLILFLLVREMFKEKLPAIVAAGLLAISPWHLHFSRGGWESNVSTFFLTLGVYFFFLALRKPKNFPFFILCFVASMFTYHSARIVAPLLGLGCILFYSKQIFKKENWRWLAIAFLTGIIPVSILAISFLKQGGVSRFSGVGMFADQGPFWRVNELRGQHVNPQSLLVKVIHNRFLEYATQFLDNYLRHFDGNFLFISGDEIQRNKIPEMGQMYLIEIPFLILGLYFLLRNKPQNWYFVFWWLAVSPVASALTFQSPHAIRALNMVIPLVLIVSYGIVNFFKTINLNQKFFLPIILNSIFIILYLWNFSFYLHQYYVHYPQTYPAAWEYGFKDLVSYVRSNQDQFAKVYVTNKYDQPYILFAFYLQYPPEKFQKEAKLTPKDQYGFSTVDHFDKYFFGPINFVGLQKEKKVMIVGSPQEIPDSATIVKRIYFKDGKTEAFRITEN